jgi:hypothetical protein
MNDQNTTKRPTRVGSDALFAALSMMAGMKPQTEYVQVVERPQHTRNLFGPIEEIAGKRLELIERNFQGDCLCLFSGVKGTNIVDVDYRDVDAANK